MDFDKGMPSKFYLDQLNESMEKLLPLPIDSGSTSMGAWSSFRYLQGFSSGLWMAGAISMDEHFKQNTILTERYNQTVLALGGLEKPPIEEQPVIEEKDEVERAS